MNTTTVEAIGDTQIRIRRAFDAPIGLVFAAHTEPGHLTQWLTGPGGMKLVEATMDLRAGGTFMWRYQGPDDATMVMQGTFLEVETPRRFVHREDWGPDLPSPEIETVFEEVGGQTVVTLTYTLSDAGMRDHIVTDGGMTEGFRISHDILHELLPTLS